MDAEAEAEGGVVGVALLIPFAPVTSMGEIFDEVAPGPSLAVALLAYIGDPFEQHDASAIGDTVVEMKLAEPRQIAEGGQSL